MRRSKRCRLPQKGLGPSWGARRRGKTRDTRSAGRMVLQHQSRSVCCPADLPAGAASSFPMTAPSWRRLLAHRRAPASEPAGTQCMPAAAGVGAGGGEGVTCSWLRAWGRAGAVGPQEQAADPCTACAMPPPRAPSPVGGQKWGYHSSDPTWMSQKKDESHLWAAGPSHNGGRVTGASAGLSSTSTEVQSSKPELSPYGPTVRATNTNTHLAKKQGQIMKVFSARLRIDCKCCST